LTAASQGLRRHAAGLGGVLLLGLLAYSNALRGPFVFDDRQHVRDNPLLRDLGNYLASGVGYRAMPHRFLANLTFALNYRLGGLSVAGYHAVNVGVHLACAALLYALVVLALQAPRLSASALAPRSRAVAFAAAALFVSHPLQTQAVTYVVQRATSLATLLYLGATVLYLRWRLLRAAGRPAPAAYGLALLCAVAAMATKEIAVTLPLALGLVELAFFDGPRRRLAALVPFAVAALLVPATWLVERGSATAVLAVAADHAARSERLAPLDYLRTEAAVVVTYLRLLVAPVGQNLDHDFPVYRSFLAPRVVGSLALVAALLGGAAWLHARAAGGGRARGLDPAVRLVSVGVAWFFLALLPESSVIPIDDVINEHRVYLPSVGFFAAVAAGGALLAGRVRRADPARLTWLTALLLSVVLAVATLRRNAVWADDVALWSDAAEKSPNKVRPLNNLAYALATARRHEEGVAVLRRAVSLDPKNPIVRNQLAAALLGLGRTAEAEPHLREAIRLDPASPEPIFNLAVMLSRTGRAAEAAGWFRRFLEVAPPSYEGLRRFAAARVESGG
jgi:tetratricopeptide (TPR) repeat protein